MIELEKPEVEYRACKNGRPLDRELISAIALDTANQHMRDSPYREEWTDEECQIYADKYWKLMGCVYPTFTAQVKRLGDIRQEIP